MHNGQYIFCNNCGKDLTVTTNKAAFRTTLTAEPIPPWDGPLTEFAVRPEPGEPHHFCHMVCLVSYLDKQRKLQAD